MNKLFVNHNGKVIPNEGGLFHSGNRAYLYGDGLFESIRVVDGEPLNIEAHVLRMLDGAVALKMRIPTFFSVEFFKNKVKELVRQSEVTSCARVRISVDRVAGGFYTPTSNEVQYFIEVYPLECKGFELNTKGLEVDLYTGQCKQNDFLSNFKTKNGLIYVMSALAAKENGLDDLLITSPKGSVLESSNSNIFVVSNGMLYTPSLEEGCLAGVMRMTIINLALEAGIKVYECHLLPQNLIAADEVFLTNAVNGIIWVGGYRTKRYKNDVVQRLVNLLNKKFIPQASI